MIRIAMLLLCLALPLQAEEFPAAYAVTGVASDDVLNIRTAPDAAAPIIGALAPDTSFVEVIAVTNGWALVNTDGQSGYASLRFLKREPGPEWSALETPLTCLGTEPFWSLKIDPGAGTTTYQTPEMPKPLTSAMTGRWPAASWDRTAAVGLADGLAVMTGAECSDGMSDRAYGIAVDLFRMGPDGGSRLRGCCLLGLR